MPARTGVEAALPDWGVGQIDAAHGPDWFLFGLGQPDQPATGPAGLIQRQYQPERLLGEKQDNGKTVHETDAIRLWTLDDDVLIRQPKDQDGA